MRLRVSDWLSSCLASCTRCVWASEKETTHQSATAFVLCRSQHTSQRLCLRAYANVYSGLDDMGVYLWWLYEFAFPQTAFRWCLFPEMGTLPDFATRRPLPEYTSVLIRIIIVLHPRPYSRFFWRCGGWWHWTYQAVPCDLVALCSMAVTMTHFTHTVVQVSIHSSESGNTSLKRPIQRGN